ncbi:MAG: hypothetical protein ABSC03_09290 [Verrucomicrobiota bacterium]|jgi:hypothetical protein
MLGWLKQMLNRGQEAALPVSGQSASPSQDAPFAVTISVCSPVSKPARFRSAALAQLWKQVGSISHPQHPFLDPAYSPGSLMPAADFSPWVAERLAADDWDSIWELLAFISTDSQITGLRHTFQSYDFSRFVEAEPALLRELHAIAILTYRIQWTGHEDSRSSLLAWLFEHSLASYPFAIHKAEIAHLLDGANKVIYHRNHEFKDMRPPEPMLRADSLIRPELPDVSAAGQALRSYPATFRTCITYSLHRGSPVPGMIRPQLQGEYGLRQFGLSDRQNSHFFTHCGLFEAPADLSLLASRLSKDELLQIAVAHGIEVTKSWKKERIIQSLLSTEAARSTIASRAGDNLVQLRCDVRTAFDAWTARVSSLRSIALCLSRA